ncbi:MAG: putative DNA mismatch repair protein MutL [Promethearchaeota archaeon]|nr:MAG: putative DNA mismatch repair protein MutL [Candidatus Lokiarchaeota archaeon]
MISKRSKREKMNERKIRKIKNADKIAAGEVVERPANVVKELVENSIDANSKEIRIIVKDAGKRMIQVIDDGIGISPRDITMAFKRHTSSKIRDVEDLETLTSLGFRGEALASIAAVSQIEITSRTNKNQMGIKLIIEGGKILDKREVSCSIGTNIKVKNLFYNLPVRRKFLKSNATELGHITDIIQRYSLAYPKTHFIYMHHDLTVLNCPASNDLKTTVFHIYGKEIAKSMMAINPESEGLIDVHGLIGHPKISKKGRSYSSFFLNQRYIISDILYRAVADAYKGVMMIGKYPFFVLFLEIDPSLVDFNVHPKKLEVRFQDEDLIYNKVYRIIRKEIERKFINEEEKHISLEIDKFSKESLYKKENTEPLTTKKVHVLNYEEDEKITEEFIPKSVQINLDDNISNESTQASRDSETYLREKYLNVKNFPKIRLISSTGQMGNNIYILLEGINKDGEQGLFILDQHAASERIHKEYFYSQYEQEKKTKQKLISPLKIEVNPSEKYFLEENLTEIKKLGFNFDHFRGNTFILREIPVVLQKSINVDLIRDIISDITEIGKDSSFSEVKEEIINYLACHRSIRGGDKLSVKEIRQLLEDLASCENPFHCAHGRPTIRFLSYKDLDKMFKRTG